MPDDFYFIWFLSLIFPVHWGTMETDLGCQRKKKRLWRFISNSEIHSRESCGASSYLRPAQIYQLNRNHRGGFLKELWQGKAEIPEKNLAAFVSAEKNCQNYVMNSVKSRTEWSEQQLTGADGLAEGSRKKTQKVYKNLWGHCERKQSHMLVLGTKKIWCNWCVM